MSKDKAKPKAQGAHAPTLYFIAGFKMLKGLLLVLLAAGIFALSDRDLSTVYGNFLRWVHLDPERGFFVNIGYWINTLTPGNLKVFASGTMLYGFFLLASGLGLALRAAWAIWLAIGESAFFIPIEIYEIIRRRLPRPDPLTNPDPTLSLDPVTQHLRSHPFEHPRLGLTLVLIVNVIIVWYLYRNRNRLFRHH